MGLFVCPMQTCVGQSRIPVSGFLPIVAASHVLQHKVHQDRGSYLSLPVTVSVQQLDSIAIQLTVLQFTGSKTAPAPLVLQLIKAVLGEEHTSVTSVLDAVAACYSQLKDYDSAIAYLKAALPIYKKHFGEKHLGTARSFVNIASCYKQKNEYDLALKYYQKGLSTIHPDLNSVNVYLSPKSHTPKTYSESSKIYLIKSEIFAERFEHQSQNPKDLLAALDNIIIATEFIDYIRQEHTMDSSKHLLAEEVMKIYNHLMQIGFRVWTVYQHAPNIPQHKEFAHIPATPKDLQALLFEFSEQCKAVVLLFNIKD